MKINENPFPSTVLGDRKGKIDNTEHGAGRIQENSDGVSISSKHKIKELMKEIAQSRTDSDQALHEIAESMKSGQYLPSADDVADAILDEMNMLGELFQWSSSSES